MTARSCILQSADSLINGDRQAEYGPPAESFGRIADYWNAYLAHHGWSGPQLHGADVAAMMALLKVARMVESPRKADTYIDASGYIALAGELAGVRP